MELSFAEIARFWHDFTSWNPPQVVMFTMVCLGIMSAWLMTKTVSAPPLITGPISFMVLTFAAMLANFSARGLVMMGTSEMQKALFLTLLGHTVSAFILLFIFKVGEKSVAK